MSDINTQVSIQAKNRGPFIVKGDITLLDADGKEIDRQGKSVIALCSCRDSQKMPFCDGAHNSCNWES